MLKIFQLLKSHAKILCIGFFLLPLSLKTFAFDTWWHAECTRKALVANGFSADARLATQVSNYLTDFLAVLNMPNEELQKAGIERIRFRSNHSYDYLHFDAVFTTKDIEKNWNLLLNNTLQCLRKYADGGNAEPGFRLIIIFNIMGASLHAIQDFYSHSNWINMHMEKRISPIPIWYDVSFAERQKLNVFTGIYQKPFTTHISHDSLNKDCSSRTFYKEAVEAAERASIDWVKRLMDSVPQVSWSELKAYNIQNDIIMKNFLSKLDATFLTSSSILGGHFDGAQSVKHVFSKEDAKERVQAGIILERTLSAYTNNMSVASNKFKLPSPYWAGFMGYNITYEIASGLLLNEKKYVAPAVKSK